MTRRKHLVLGSLVLLATAAGNRPARAEFPGASPYIGVSGGYNLRLRDWDLGGIQATNDETGPGQPTSSPLVALRLGYQILPRFGVEAAGTYLPVESSNEDVLNHVLKLDVTAVVHLTSGEWAPFVAIGGGLYKLFDDGGLGSDVDPVFHAGLGVRGLVLPWLAFRAEVRDAISDGYDDWGSHNLEMAAGFDFFLAKAAKPAPQVVDRDADGVPDLEDKCPAEAGRAETNGCPDRDSDGVVDAQDKCPATAGSPALGGCPDKDADGVADADDKCPDVAGKKELGGCPDGDGDGVADAADKCPAVAGKAELGGCPDRDGDSVTDAEDKCPDVSGKPELGGCPDSDADNVADAQDKCPDVAGKPELAGCPDRDNDGVADAEDKCPDQTGLKEEQGCVPKAVQKFTGTIKGINFDKGSAKLTKSSSKVLDATTKVLAQYPSLRLRIEGHTDNVGQPEQNKKLSQERADSVKTYLVSKGVDANRLEAVGYGDTKPKQDNAKPAGRAANRRIEFVVIQ